MATRPVGRPMKYRHFIENLEDGVLYTPARIVQHGEMLGFFQKIRSPKLLKKEKQRIRHTLARFSTNHQFPNEGDGMVFLKGQAPTRGWTGKRWKAALPETAVSQRKIPLQRLLPHPFFHQRRHISV